MPNDHKRRKPHADHQLQPHDHHQGRQSRHHTKTGIGEEDVSAVSMRYTGEDGKAFHVSIVSAPVPQDIATIRMNVRDFDEAYHMLEEKGFRNIQGNRVTNTGSSKATMMVSPSGFTISVSEHLRTEDK